ncbi:zinc finger C2HC domain-containing protein 1C isoform X2 [Drosophila obscura]|uniref:zinc finger C2HC domain-containing protein 1C isoform X2 n=1 Tax=Drosophila obscura TaxID=7282 RepID=UPI000BA07058|nr:zinc finger C2HC domain-containing protein 1C isoform X2 [Drosophila obscura]XP_022210947.1 zinc finger C2HC domain-containing protein 1C isoform X2 [Drosophila obscura]
MSSNGSGEVPLRPSKLGDMRMRFQKAEEERRRNLLTGRPGGNGLATAAPSAVSSRLVGNGKVRQMFDERRRGAGIDRSNPLKPIGGGATTPPAQPARTQPTVQRLIKDVSAMSLKDKPVFNRRLTSDSNNNSNKYNPAGTVSRLKPVITRKTPPREVEAASRSIATTPRSPMPKATARAKAPSSRETAAASSRQSPPLIRKAVAKSPVPKKTMSQPPPEGTSPCRYCGRHFNTDRLGKHEDVCQRTMTTKRKIFDASKQRVGGTEAEKFTNKKGNKAARSQSSYSSAAQVKGLVTGVKKSNWRKKHEEFIQTIRSAKQAQAHVARGGKLSDLPPPPPSENPDYIQCPHCGRRFNQTAAERHIPKCATMIHNKPRQNGPVPMKKR